MTLEPGVANERTALAWQRTALSVIAGSAILSRLAFDRLGAVALVSVAVGAPVGLWVFAESRYRYRHDAGIQRRLRPRGGRAAAILSAATTVVALTELAALLGG